MFYFYSWQWGDELGQWLQCWTGDQKVEGSNPIRNTRKTFSKRLCWLAIGVRIYMHTKDHVRTLKIL